MGRGRAHVTAASGPQDTHHCSTGGHRGGSLGRNTRHPAGSEKNEDTPMREKSGESLRVEEGDEWVCLCGNEAWRDGFAPCTAEGRPIEPTLGGAWDTIHYVCLRCGRIIDQHTLGVTGLAGPVPDHL